MDNKTTIFILGFLLLVTITMAVRYRYVAITKGNFATCDEACLAAYFAEFERCYDQRQGGLFSTTCSCRCERIES